MADKTLSQIIGGTGSSAFKLSAGQQVGSTITWPLSVQSVEIGRTVFSGIDISSFTQVFSVSPPSGKKLAVWFVGINSITPSTNLRARVTIDGREMIDETGPTSASGNCCIFGELDYVDIPAFYEVETSIVLEAEQAGETSADGVLYYWVIE